MYFGHRVEIRAFGITYKGMLVGADEDTIYIKAQTTWITIPLAEVSSLKPLDAAEGERMYKPVDGEREGLSDEEKAQKREAAFKLQVIAGGEPDDNGGGEG